MRVCLWITVLIAATLCSGSAFCNDVSSYFNKYVGKAGAGPFFYAECAQGTGKVILYFPVGGRSGDFATFSRGHGQTYSMLSQAGKISFSGDKAKVRDLLNGGPGTYEAANEFVNRLLKRPFSIVSPSDFEKLETSIPSESCPEIR